MYICTYIYIYTHTHNHRYRGVRALATISEALPSGNQTWLAGRYPMNGGFHGKLTDKWSIFQHAMFDYRRVNLEGTNS